MEEIFLPQELPVSELVLEELPEAMGEAETAPGIPKRRFLPNTPLAEEPEPILPLPNTDDGTELVETSPDSSNLNISANSEGAMPLLSFVGVDQDIRAMEIPPEPAVDLAVNIGETIDSSTGGDSPLVITQNHSGQSLSSHFYNLPLKGKKLLFIIEAMTDWAESEEGRILSLENELQRVVDSLDDEVLFNIWVYSRDKISLCNKGYMPANAGNKAFSIIWIKSYFRKDNERFIEENKPIGYPDMYTSKSGLEWAPPLLLAVENQPEAIFLLSSSWNTSPSNQEGVLWTDQKEAAWQAALNETQRWIEEENQERALDGIPPRAIFNIKKLVARRHPEVAVPPALPRMHEDKIHPELKQQFQKSDISNQCPIFVLLHPNNFRDSQVDLQKFSSLVTPYKGSVYLVK